MSLRPGRPAAFRWSEPRRISIAIALCLMAAQGRPARAAQPGHAADAGALQALADVILVESECRDLSVDYGRLFAFAERNGIRPIDIMPLGQNRTGFNADYRRRALAIPGEQLCTDFANGLAVTIPGVFKPR